MTATKVNRSSPLPLRMEQLPAIERRIITTDDRRRRERRTLPVLLANREKRLRLVEQNAGIGTYDVDCATGQAYCSPELRAIAGLPPQDSAPISLAQLEALIHPEDRLRIVPKIHSILESQEPVEFEDEWRILRPDGSVSWVKNKGRVFFIGDDGKQRSGVVTGIVIDVTSHRAEAALAQRRAELAALVESALDAIIGVDTDHRIDLFNPAACRIFRCSTIEALGAPLETFISPDILAATQGHVRQIAENGVTVPLVDQPLLFTGRRFDGEEFPLEASFAKVEVQGEWRLMITIQDISERREAEEMLQRLKDQLECQIGEQMAEQPQNQETLESSNARLQQFVLIAAHDLQAPLRSIKGFASMLQHECNGRLGAQGDTWLNQLLRSTQRMQALIQDLMDYSRVDSQGNAFEPTDLGQIMDDVVISLDAEIREAGGRVTWERNLPVVMGNPAQLGQLLQNLVGNGIKYHGDRRPRVRLSARHGDGEWIVSVRDNGIGIPERDQEGIFELFRRLHSHQEYPGTGVGLAVCRRIVQRHGGRIWVESSPGQGSVFHFTLPER